MDTHNKFKEILSKLLNNNYQGDYLRYIHQSGVCNQPCYDCPRNHLRIFENNNEKPKVGWSNHWFCHCYYESIETKSAGSISNKGIYSPDVYLKAWGKLPDYYITKEDAYKLGWHEGKNLAHFAPGKMIGNEVYDNKNKILPMKEGRIWYHCDVDYTEGKRNSKRLYYSNDGLMFYTDLHNPELDPIIFIK